jgi:hypothetical protein
MPSAKTVELTVYGVREEVSGFPTLDLTTPVSSWSVAQRYTVPKLDHIDWSRPLEVGGYHVVGIHLGMEQRLSFRTEYHGWRLAVDLGVITNTPETTPATLQQYRNWLDTPETYRRLPFDTESWFSVIKRPQLPLVSKTDQGLMMSFFENEAKKEAGRRTEMRLGRYIRRFSGGAKAAHDIEKMVVLVEQEIATLDVKFTQDADEIEEIYVNGPRSCMNEEAGHYEGHCHPVRVYAGPDLALAYLGTTEEARARVLVWPEKKVYSTPYSNSAPLKALLVEQLQAQGYQNGYLSGARIRRIANDCSSVIMPYVDGVCGADEAGDDKYLILGGSDYETDNTSGTARLGGEVAQTWCPHCDEYHDDDDMIWIEGDDRSWCSSCTYNDTSICDHSGDRYRDDQIIEMYDDDGNAVSVASWYVDRYHDEPPSDDGDKDEDVADDTQGELPLSSPELVEGGITYVPYVPQRSYQRPPYWVEGVMLAKFNTNTPSLTGYSFDAVGHTYWVPKEAVVGPQPNIHTTLLSALEDA